MSSSGLSFKFQTHITIQKLPNISENSSHLCSSLPLSPKPVSTPIYKSDKMASLYSQLSKSETESLSLPCTLRSQQSSWSITSLSRVLEPVLSFIYLNPGPGPGSSFFPPKLLQQPPHWSPCLSLNSSTTSLSIVATIVIFLQCSHVISLLKTFIGNPRQVLKTYLLNEWTNEWMNSAGEILSHFSFSLLFPLVITICTFYFIFM